MTYHQPKIYLDSACWGVKIQFRNSLIQNLLTQRGNPESLCDTQNLSGAPYSWRMIYFVMWQKDGVKTPPEMVILQGKTILRNCHGVWGVGPVAVSHDFTTQDSFGLRVFRDMDMEKALEEWNLVQAGRNLTTSWRQSCEDWRNFYANFWEFQWNGGRQWIHGLSFRKVLKISTWNCQKRWNE